MTNMKKYLVVLARQLDRCKMKNKGNNKANSRTATMEGQIVFVLILLMCGNSEKNEKNGPVRKFSRSISFRV